ncbi:MAG: glycosyltransferase [Ignavibacteria bacterium]|jgi:glycosyltransferase involved in cell wall biosynthesis
MPKIAVIIPTYNRAQIITESIVSVLHQTFKDFELIVVDDGSTDNTKEVVANINDHRIRYIYQNNHGASAARNAGIKASTSEYVAFLDSDDFYVDNAVEKAINCLESHPNVGFSYGQCYVSRLGGNIYRTRKSAFHDNSTIIEPFMQIRELLLICPITLSSLTVRRRCFDEVGIFNEDLFFGEDFHMFIRLAKKYPAFYIAEPLITQTVHDDSLRHTIIKPGGDKAFPLILQEIFNDPAIAPNFSDIKNSTYSHYYSEWIMLSYWGTNMKLARKYLRMAVQCYPQVVVSRRGLYIFYKYIASFLPDKIRIGLRNIKRRFKYTMEEQEANNLL